ncbi:hypothetical protein AX16_006025 [Volvariella volvacea WC 439]|nr:hypothetical protein AX16_006025 [Volvariella volvacea WC 439]
MPPELLSGFVFRLQAILYETVVLGDQDFHRESKSPLHHPPRFPSGPQTAFVRNLVIADWDAGFTSELEPTWRDLLPQCYNLQHFAIWAHHYAPYVLPVLTMVLHSPLCTVSSHGLLRLSAPLKELFPHGSMNFHHEIFKYLTHLEVLEFSSETGGQWLEGNNYGCLPSLRYLFAFSFDWDFPFPSEVLLKCLTECKTLEMLILQEPNDRNPGQVNSFLQATRPRQTVNFDGMAEEVPEDRVIVYRGPFIPGEGWTEDWYRGTLGGDDVWIQSKKILQRRRRKRELEANLWYLLVNSDAECSFGK